MFPVSFKKALKKMGHYNKKWGKDIATPLHKVADNQDASAVYTTVSVEDDGDIALPILPSSYFESV